MEEAVECTAASPVLRMALNLEAIWSTVITWLWHRLYRRDVRNTALCLRSGMGSSLGMLLALDAQTWRKSEQEGWWHVKHQVTFCSKASSHDGC